MSSSAASATNPLQDEASSSTAEVKNKSSVPTMASKSFLDEITSRERHRLQLQVDEFILSHTNADTDAPASSLQRPLVLVTSGGTAVEIDGGVRFLENFSTGKRGAMSVEEFLKRGYAVIHLKRTGSVAPYARVLNELLMTYPEGSITTETVGKLFTIPGQEDDIDEEDEMVQAVLRRERQQQSYDPFLTDPIPTTQQANTATSSSTYLNGHAHGDYDHDDNMIRLNRVVARSSRLREALKERYVAVIQENRLLTIDFRTVQEYLGKLQLICESLRDCNTSSMVIVYLAAAVSDFYIPANEKSPHKIQSADHASEKGLTLRLRPVPKTLATLRKEWIPEAFVVSFKLETDMDILRTKSERAVSKYGSHLVIGNLLPTRHQNVWVLSPESQSQQFPTDATSWEMHEISKQTYASTSKNKMNDDHPDLEDDSGHDDSLESSIIDYVVQSHFEYISFHYNSASGSNTKADRESAERIRASARRARQNIVRKRRNIQKQRLWDQFSRAGIEVLGVVLAMSLSYAINTALQRRLYK